MRRASFHWGLGIGYLLAGGRGFEPRLTVPETAVLPLDDPPAAVNSTTSSLTWQMPASSRCPALLARTSKATRSGIHLRGSPHATSASAGHLGASLLGRAPVLPPRAYQSLQRFFGIAQPLQHPLLPQDIQRSKEGRGYFLARSRHTDDAEKLAGRQT